jgi:hypothetical protein
VYDESHTEHTDSPVGQSRLPKLVWAQSCQNYPAARPCGRDCIHTTIYTIFHTSQCGGSSTTFRGAEIDMDEGGSATLNQCPPDTMGDETTLSNFGQLNCSKASRLVHTRCWSYDHEFTHDCRPRQEQAPCLEDASRTHLQRAALQHIKRGSTQAL